jgi:cysteine desulfurase/selenocysteine lyase
LYGVTASARASLSFITTIDEIDRFSEELASTVDFLKAHG